MSSSACIAQGFPALGYNDVGAKKQKKKKRKNDSCASDKNDGVEKTF
jgi:hypothetical protein